MLAWFSWAWRLYEPLRWRHDEPVRLSRCASSVPRSDSTPRKLVPLFDSSEVLFGIIKFRRPQEQMLTVFNRARRLSPPRKRAMRRMRGHVAFGRALAAEEELARVSSTLAVARRSSGSQHASLAEQLADTLRTLHGTLQERDRLRAALDEALASCASSLVAREVAEASLQKQLLGIASLGEAASAARAARRC